MKKYIFTEEQIKKVIDSVVLEQSNGVMTPYGITGGTRTSTVKKPQMSPEDKFAQQQKSSFDAVYNNPPITQQMKKYPQGTKFGFSPAKAAQISKMSHSNILYKVQPGDTIEGLVKNKGANSKENILGDNDLLRNNPMNLQADMVITFSLLPSR
jgi:hypothetical protein